VRVCGCVSTCVSPGRHVPRLLGSPPTFERAVGAGAHGQCSWHLSKKRTCKLTGIGLQL